MSEYGFTPGPWSTEPHGNTTALYSGRGQNRHGLRLMNLDDGDSNFIANARLISAAPDLLEALVAIDDMWSDDGEGGRVNPIDARSGKVREVWGQARAAIAKAVGRG